MSVLEQQVPEGFKRTDVGIIPEDWAVSPLFEVCGFGGGTTPPRSQHDRYFVGGSNNWIKTTDLNNSLIGTSEELITEEAISETGLKKHPVGTVLVAMYGGFNQIGRTGLITKPSAINQALVAVKPKPKKLDSYYLLSELNYNVDYWKGVASSSRKDPNITSNDVKNYKIALPSVEEQTAIANALSDVDALLAELEKLIAKKQAIKTATMQQLLTGKTRLTQFATYTEGEKLGQPKGTKSSELGEIPEDWDVKAMGDLGTTFGGLSGKNKNDFGHGRGRYVPFTNVMANTVIDEEHLEKVDVNEPQNEVRKNDLLFNGSSETPDEVCFCSLVASEIDNLFLNSFCFGFRAKSQGNYIPLYLAYWFRSNNGRSAVSIMAQGSTRYNISKSQFLRLSTVLPPIEEQTAIASIFSDMDREIQAFEQRLAKTRQIKQGMMQELLTGRTRLPFDKES